MPRSLAPILVSSAVVESPAAHPTAGDVLGKALRFAVHGFLAAAGIAQRQIHVHSRRAKDTWAPPTDLSPTDNPFRLRHAFLIETGPELRAPDAMPFAPDHPDVTLRKTRAYYAAKKSSKQKS